MQEHHLEYLLAVTSGFPSIYKDEVISECYVRACAVDLDSRDYKQYLRNVAYRVLRKIREAKGDCQLIFDAPDKSDHSPIFKLELSDLHEGISHLPESWQQVLWAASKYSTIQEAADALEITIDSFKKRKMKAIAKLKRWTLANRPDLTEFL